MSSKVITVTLQFEQDQAFTNSRARFREHFTDQIRAMNANPHLGKLRTAYYAKADEMNTIASMDAKAYGSPTASLPKTWQRCAACTNDVFCAMSGGCVAAQKAVDKAAQEIGMHKITHGVVTGRTPMRQPDDLFPKDEPLPARRAKKTVVKKVAKKVVKKTKGRKR